MTKKKIMQIAVVVLIIMLAFCILWFGFLYPNKFFKEQEETLSKAGKRYFEINMKYLPKEEGRVLSVSLNTLIKQKYLEDLMIPYSKEICDIKASSVRMVKRDGKEHYYTYLKCGKYESDVDHEGPVITLNDKNKIVINRGDTFTDPGVKSVKDKVDGDLAIADVIIKGNVDTSKIGTYRITYTANDTLNNKTTVTRTIEVVEKLAKTVKEVTQTGLYQGESINNYILFQNILFRIVRANEDDTVTIVADSPLAYVDFSLKNKRFSNSSMDQWLNGYFYDLFDDEYKNLLVATKWCEDTITMDTIQKTECDQYSEKRNVGLLSLQDYNKSRDDKGQSYLNVSNLSWYLNYDAENKPWAMTSMATYPAGAIALDDTSLAGVRPALTLKKNLTIVSGDGSMDNPYQVLEKKEVKKNSKINTRQVGEYIQYSGYLWRIADVLKDGTTEVIMHGVLVNGETDVVIGYDPAAKTIYNPKEKGNIGYLINQQMSQYVKTDLFVKKKIDVPVYDKLITYKGKKTKQSYTVTLSSPSTFEIFSAKAKNSSGTGYWLIDSSKQEYQKLFVYSVGSVPYLAQEDNDGKFGVKARAYFNKDVIVKDGKGTSLNPYTVSK